MIGIFDSGIGGLTVVREIKKRFPNKSIMYFGDTARVPWGNKSKKIVRQYSSEICDFLIAKGCNKIIIACNTASALSSGYLRKKYPKIIFIDVINPTIEKITGIKKTSENNLLRVGVIGTKATIGSKIYEEKIKKESDEIEVFSQACPLFVPLAEENQVTGETAMVIVKDYLSYLKEKKINVLVLGCTHYPLLKDKIRKFLGDEVKIINSAAEAAKQIKSDNFNSVNENKEDQYYFSDWTQNHKNLSKTILNKKIEVEVVEVI